MLSGHATVDGTADFAASSKAHASNFRKFHNLTFSNVGVGTYLGDADAATDKLVEDAVVQSVLSGINVIDTAINYRFQKAERAVGRAISQMVSQNQATRQQVFISTKNGYVTNDADKPQEFWQYVKDQFTSKGIVGEGDISSGYHCMTVPYLSDQLDRSLENLGMDCIDLLYLHNAVEGQIKDMPRPQFLENLYKVFEMYEEKRSQGKIRFYGMATWECFRVPKENPNHLLLSDVVQMAEQIAGSDHGFRFIQLPFNMYYDQALLKEYQVLEGRDVSILECARQLGIGVFTSVPFMQGRLLQPGTTPEFNNLTPPLRALQFLRSAPGVLAPLAGQKSPDHVRENVKIMQEPPLSESEFWSLVKKFTS